MTNNLMRATLSVKIESSVGVHVNTETPLTFTDRAGIIQVFMFLCSTKTFLTLTRIQAGIIQESSWTVEPLVVSPEIDQNVPKFRTVVRQ